MSYGPHLRLVKALPARQAMFYDKPPAGLFRPGSPPTLALQRLGIGTPDRLYRHQGQLYQRLAEEMSQEEATILATPLGSGRTTVLALAVLRQVMELNRNVLLVYPEADGGHQEMEQLVVTWEKAGWLWSLCRQSLWEAGAYETPRQAADLPEILFTTVGILHHHLLREHTHWRPFFERLGLVIVDQAAVYHGLWGSNAALVFRRLRRICQAHGAAPHYLGIAGGVGNPRDLARELLGLDPGAEGVIGESLAALDERVIACFNAERPWLARQKPQPGMVEPPATHYFATACQMTLDLARMNFRPLLCTAGVQLTRNEALSLQSRLREQLEKELGCPRPDLAAQVSPQSPAQHDAASIAGLYPAARQMSHDLSHLGIGQADALICFVVPPTPLAQHHARRMARYLEFTDEAPHAILTTANPLIARNHLCCALDELPLDEREAARLFGPACLDTLSTLVASGEAQVEVVQEIAQDTLTTFRRYRPAPAAQPDPHHRPLNVAGDQAVALLVENRDNALLGYLDLSRAQEMAYEGALLFQADDRYQVVRADLPAAVYVRQDERNAFQETIKLSRVELVPAGSKNGGWPGARSLSIAEGLPIQVGLGEFEVREEVHAHVRRNLFSELRDRTLARFPEPHRREMFVTEAVYLAFADESSAYATADTLHGLVHLFRSLLPVLVQGVEEVDIVAMPEKEGRPAAICFYDNAPGSLGLARFVKDKVEELLRLAYDLVTGCPCQAGCPGCLEIAACHEDPPNAGLNKQGVVNLLSLILGRQAVTTDRPLLTGDAVHKTFHWAYSPVSTPDASVAQTLDLYLSRERYERYRREPRLPARQWNTYPATFMPEVSVLAARFAYLHHDKGWSTLDQAGNVLAFTQQCIRYTRDEDTTGQSEWPRYPIETLMEEQGDCEDDAILAAAVLKRLGFDVALLHYPGHCALGVAGAPGLPGQYVEDKRTGLRYYYGEATADGWHIGEVPAKFQEVAPEIEVVQITIEA